MYWVNGVPKKTVSLNNRALHFGDGFFTTAKMKDGKVHFLSLHINRLMISAKKLMFSNLNFDLLRKEIVNAATYSKQHEVIKVIIIRKDDRSFYGYKYKDDIEPIRVIRTGKLPDNYIKWRRFGIKLQMSILRLAKNSFLAGIKHLNRLEQVMISNWVSTYKLFDEALILDTDDNVVECCNANIFWRKNNKVFTPILRYAGVKGIMRQLVLNLLPKLGYDIQEVMVGIEHIKDAHEVFITNSLMPIVPVNAINNNSYLDKTLFYLLNSYFCK